MSGRNMLSTTEKNGSGAFNDRPSSWVSEWLHYVADNEREIMTAADGCCCCCFGCCLRQCRFCRVSAAAAAAAGYDPAASCPRSLPISACLPQYVRPSIDCCFICCWCRRRRCCWRCCCRRDHPAGAQHIMRPSVPAAALSSPAPPPRCSRLIADSAVDSAPLAVCRLVLWLIHSCRRASERANDRRASLLAGALSDNCRGRRRTTICPRRFSRAQSTHKRFTANYHYWRCSTCHRELRFVYKSSVLIHVGLFSLLNFCLPVYDATVSGACYDVPHSASGDESNY